MEIPCMIDQHARTADRDDILDREMVVAGGAAAAVPGSDVVDGLGLVNGAF
jgi:hypothetical protein